MAGVAPSHAGGVVYRLKDGLSEYLLIRPKSGLDEWLLPKGHVEEGETEREAALREVREETGVVAQVMRFIDDIEFVVPKKSVKSRFFLMRMISEEGIHEQREHGWFPYKEALKTATHSQTRHLLEQAERARLESQSVH